MISRQEMVHRLVRRASEAIADRLLSGIDDGRPVPMFTPAERALAAVATLRRWFPSCDVGAYGPADPYLVVYVETRVDEPWHAVMTLDGFSVFFQHAGSIPPRSPWL